MDRGGHRPFEDLPYDHQKTLLALFKQYGVSFYFAGHGHSYTRFDAAAWGDGAVHVMAGGAGNEETEFPADQFDTENDTQKKVEKQRESRGKGLGPCEFWCARIGGTTLAAPATPAAGSPPATPPPNEGAPEREAQASAAKPRASEADSCGNGNDPLNNPCRHCSPPGVGPPAAATDKLALGVLTATTTSLEWRLLRAPDGAVLDTVTLTR